MRTGATRDDCEATSNGAVNCPGDERSTARVIVQRRSNKRVGKAVYKKRREKKEERE
jgi:hypothetical protein